MPSKKISPLFMSRCKNEYELLHKLRWKIRLQLAGGVDRERATFWARVDKPEIWNEVSHEKRTRWNTANDGTGSFLQLTSTSVRNLYKGQCLAPGNFERCPSNGFYKWYLAIMLAISFVNYRIAPDVWENIILARRICAHGSKDIPARLLKIEQPM